MITTNEPDQAQPKAAHFILQGKGGVGSAWQKTPCFKKSRRLIFDQPALFPSSLFARLQD